MGFWGFIVPLTEGDSLGAERQAGGQAGRNVSSCPGQPATWLVLDPPRELRSRCPPLQGGQSLTPCFAVSGQLCLLNVSLTFFQKLSKKVTMAASLILAITTDGKIRGMRQGRQEIQQPGFLRFFHFRPILRGESDIAFSIVRDVPFVRRSQKRLAGSKVRHPHVVPVIDGIPRF